MTTAADSPTASRPGTPKTRQVLLRSSTMRTSSSSSSLSSLFAAASLTNKVGTTPSKSLDSARSLICRAFVPHVAVHVSQDTEDLAREKGFADFKEMLRPYGEDLQGRLTVRDSVGSSNSYDDFGVRFVGLAEAAAAGERWETGASAWAANGGRVAVPSREKVFVGGNIDEVEELVGAHLEQNEEPANSDQFFYLHYLRRLLSALPVSPHETFSHPVACVIAISSRNPAPIETLRNLYNSGNQVALPNYVNAEYLRYYVLVHDEDKDDIMKSTSLFDQMKKHFGLSCHLLRLRSGGKTAVTDDDAVIVPTSQWRSASEELASVQTQETEETPPLCLPETDATGISTMVREMTQMSVVPFMERCIATWNDQVASRRRGLSGRFLTMSKRYFGSGSSRSSASSSSNYDPVSASYPPSSPEAQMRKLADFAFMLRDWKLAHGVYDMLRTDFNNDKAWKYHAAAHEMTAISLILTNTPLSHKARQETIDPMVDVACYTYVNRCSSTYASLRCLLVIVELLRVRGGSCVDDAAKFAMRARETHGLGPIGHALITERVGDCYAVREGTGSKALGSRRRKAAMWRMLAAKEWVAEGKPGRARHCLDGALPVYERSNFSGIVAFVEGLKEAAGYTPLISVGDETPEVESERLELGSKRKSMVTPEVDGLALNDDFVESQGGGGYF